MVCLNYFAIFKKYIGTANLISFSHKPRSIVVIAEFNDSFGNTLMINFVFDYENKKWFKNGTVIQTPNPSTKRFLVPILGHFFYMRIIFNATENYFVSDDRWFKTSSIIDEIALKYSTYLSVIQCQSQNYIPTL